MNKVPKNVRESMLSLWIQRYFPKEHQGKVWDTFSLGKGSGMLLRMASDRISIFDFVLPFTIPFKGIVLNKLTIFWCYILEKAGIKHHVLFHGEAVWGQLVGLSMLRDITIDDDFMRKEIIERCVIVKKLNMIPYELIVRGYLTGSGWEAYQQNNGMVCGHLLPTGLNDGSKLPTPIFTPTTKNDKGHDEHVPESVLIAKYGTEIRELAFSVFNTISRVLSKLGILIADMKIEAGYDEKGNLIVADEFGGPDTCRFWLSTMWQKAQELKTAPIGYDKQFVREKGKQIQTLWGHGINRLKPDNEEHVNWVHDCVQFSKKVIIDTSALYLEIYNMITGIDL